MIDQEARDVCKNIFAAFFRQSRQDASRRSSRAGADFDNPDKSIRGQTFQSAGDGVGDQAVRRVRHGSVAVDSREKLGRAIGEEDRKRVQFASEDRRKTPAAAVGEEQLSFVLRLALEQLAQQVAWLSFIPSGKTGSPLFPIAEKPAVFHQHFEHPPQETIEA